MSRTRFVVAAASTVTAMVLVGLAPAGAGAAPGWRNCGDPGEGRVFFIADVKSRGPFCGRAIAFARSYEVKVIETPGTDWPDRHRGYRCFERQTGPESSRFTCKQDQKRINFTLGV